MIGLMDAAKLMSVDRLSKNREEEEEEENTITFRVKYIVIA